MTVPAGNVVVVILRAAIIWMLSCFVAVCAVGTVESVALTVNVVVPAVPVGVPVIAPVLAFSKRPAGSAPTEMVQVTGGVPPALSNVAPE